MAQVGARGRGRDRGIQASRSEELGRYWNRLPRLPGRAASPRWPSWSAPPTRRSPRCASLRGAAPELERFLRAAEPFARETRGSIDDLGERGETRAAAPSRESREEIARAAPRWPAFAPRLGKPLRQFLQTIDDRKRSTENDPLAARPRAARARQDRLQGGPGLHRHGGAPGTTSTSRRSASTRSTSSATCCGSSAFTGGPCSPYSAKPTAAEIKECDSLARAQPARRDHARPDRRRRRPRGEPRRRRPSAARAPTARRAARASPRPPPVPGQRDISKPQIVLPDNVKRAARPARQACRRTPPAAARAARRRGQRRRQLLDYLLRAMRRRGATQSLVASPVLVGAVTVLVAIDRGLPRLQRQHRAAVRAHLRREGRDPRRVEPGRGQRGAHRRLPRRRGGPDPARHRRPRRARAERPGPRRALDRGDRR